ncbi:chitin synthase [Plakobranchus ocellatus]|uniref:Chitin synthase n=1 Tax=Plakobranchus ocellatus TaxID=259542 RepID=A0AAV4D5E8_9GAST|nr:chitin synthase [Plakobranchus ocellatus]
MASDSAFTACFFSASALLSAFAMSVIISADLAMAIVALFFFIAGEDQRLCTLLLQQRHRIDYSAGADALTFAPETFKEFFQPAPALVTLYFGQYDGPPKVLADDSASQQQD